MKLKLDQTSIILVGYWNRLIFTPDWVGGRLLLGQPELSVKVPFLPIDPVVYETPLVALFVSLPKLVIQLRENTATAFEYAEELAIRILDILDDTPVKALGVNFSFETKCPGSVFTDSITGADETALGAAISNRKLVRGIVLNSRPVNLSLTLTGNIGVIHLNFHHDIAKPRDGIPLLKGKTLELLRVSESMIEKVYDLKRSDRDEC